MPNLEFKRNKVRVIDNWNFSGVAKIFLGYIKGEGDDFGLCLFSDRQVYFPAGKAAIMNSLKGSFYEGLRSRYSDKYENGESLSKEDIYPGLIHDTIDVEDFCDEDVAIFTDEHLPMEKVAADEALCILPIVENGEACWKAREEIDDALMNDDDEKLLEDSSDDEGEFGEDSHETGKENEDGDDADFIDSAAESGDEHDESIFEESEVKSEGAEEDDSDEGNAARDPGRDVLNEGQDERSDSADANLSSPSESPSDIPVLKKKRGRKPKNKTEVKAETKEVKAADNTSRPEAAPQEAVPALTGERDANGNINCIDCENCFNCINCTGCKNCSNCVNCDKCFYCDHCVNCLGVIKSEDCINCEYCEICFHCSNSSKIRFCKSCHSCKNIQCASNIANGVIDEERKDQG